MRLSSFSCLLLVVGWSVPGLAQSTSATPAKPSAPTAAPSAPQTKAPEQAAPKAGEKAGEKVSENVEAAPAEPPATEAPATAPPPSAPAATPPAASSAPDAAGIAPEQVKLEAAGNETVPSPGELGDRLVGDLAPANEPKEGWTAPTPVLTLHGYLRARGELQDHFWLGRVPVDVLASNPAEHITAAGLGPDPFTRFRPLERQTPQTDCGNAGMVSDALVGNVCNISTLQYANMRFRLSPQLNVSEDVRVKATFDVFDNFVLGQGPQGFYGTSRGADTAFAGTDAPSTQTIVARRAWAEVRNRDLGELRFGIMPQHWGLGMLYNAGNGLDHDYSTDLGSVMGITKVAGFYLSASYDFLAEGMLGNKNNVYLPDFDGSQIDDVDQFSFSVVRRVPDEEEHAVLDRGDALINGGIHFTIRHQGSIYDKLEPSAPTPSFTTLNALMYTPDVWAQYRYRGLRLEFEGAWIAGHMRDLPQGSSGPRTGSYTISQAGAVLESEVRALNNKLGVYFYTGVATGDSDVEGLSSNANFITQMPTARGTDTTVSTFRFHPSYQVDTILWRSIMRQVTGAYYFKPGISYDFVRDDFGQLFGARLDAIWSRATAFLQTPGNAADLGVELNAQVYWRSDDGPGKNDGYHAALQYGVLFPMRGLGYPQRSGGLDTAQTLRLLLGVVF